MEELKESIERARNLRPSSVNAYVFNVIKLHDHMYGNKDFKNIEWIVKDQKKIMEYLNKQKITTRKTILASLIVALTSDDKEKHKEVVQKYRDVMVSDTKEYKTIQQEQKKTQSESENWTSLEVLRAVLNKYKKELNDRGVFSGKDEELKRRDFELLQKYVVGFLYIGDDEFNPPQRNVYGTTKIISLKDYNNLSKEELKQNYLVVQSKNNKFFSLGDYKTEKTYGINRIPAGKKLNAVLNIWLHHNKSDFLILNSKGAMMGTNGLTKYLNSVFAPSGKKNISSTMLRHIFITEKISGPSYAEKQDIAKKMGHSVDTQEIYRKT